LIAWVRAFVRRVLGDLEHADYLDLTVAGLGFGTGLAGQHCSGGVLGVQGVGLAARRRAARSGRLTSMTRTRSRRR